jgi:hypothetical protein
MTETELRAEILRVLDACIQDVKAAQAEAEALHKQDLSLQLHWAAQEGEKARSVLQIFWERGKAAPKFKNQGYVWGVLLFWPKDGSRCMFARIPR